MRYTTNVNAIPANTPTWWKTVGATINLGNASKDINFSANVDKLSVGDTIAFNNTVMKVTEVYRAGFDFHGQRVQIGHTIMYFVKESGDNPTYLQLAIAVLQASGLQFSDIVTQQTALTPKAEVKPDNGAPATKSATVQDLGGAADFLERATPMLLILAAGFLVFKLVLQKQRRH